MNNDMIKFELMDACSDNKCPICELINKRTLKSMDSFLYESVNDIDIRNRLKKSCGLCNYHSNMLMNMGNPLAHAIIYGDLLEGAIINSKRNNFGNYSYHTDCMYCEEARIGEASYINSFIKNYGNAEFRNKYISSGILCMSHLGLIKKASDNKHLTEIYEIISSDTLKKYEFLCKCLSEIRRKSDYRYSSEAWSDDERTSWQRAVAVINSISYDKTNSNFK